MREGIGTDFYNYKEIYDDITLNDTFSVEIGFVSLNYLAFYLGGFKVLLFITALLNLLAILFILKRLCLNIPVGIITYYSLFYLNHNFNTIRHGLMTAFVWLAFFLFFERKKIKSAMLYITAFFFHNLAFIFYPLQFLTKHRINFKFSVGLLILLFGLGNISQQIFILLNIYISQFSNKLDYYLNDYYGDEIARYKFGLGFILYIIIYFLILKFEKLFENRKQIVFFNRILFLGIATIILFASISIFSERIANTLLVSLVFIFSSIDRVKVNKLKYFILLFLILSINFFYLIKTLTIPGIDRIYQFVPYDFSFFLQQKTAVKICMKLFVV